MKIHFLRHATFILEYDGLNFLVDPMLGPEETRDALPNTPNPRRNPLTPLPISQDELSRLIDGLDAVLVTHTHADHWDETAQAALPKSLRIYCQPEDEEKIQSAGFMKVKPVVSEGRLGQIQIWRSGGQHGSGEIGRLMAPVSGFILGSKREPGLYIAGDSIWCEEVNQAITENDPGVIIVNAGAAQFLEGGPITMTAPDVAQVCDLAPESKVIAVHMEAINHCLLTRADLQKHLSRRKLSSRVEIPDDGQVISI
jgi:L-ascorbate metabolism protein UlaG (beta-lactamase superfamily)